MDLHWLPICSRIIYKMMVLTYHALNDEAPDYIKSLLTPNVPTRTLMSSDKPSLVAHHYNTKSYSAQAFCLCLTEYNALPLMIPMAPTLSAFKSRLKTHLFCTSYEVWVLGLPLHHVT